MHRGTQCRGHLCYTTVTKSKLDSSTTHWTELITPTLFPLPQIHGNYDDHWCVTRLPESVKKRFSFFQAQIRLFALNTHSNQPESQLTPRVVQTSRGGSGHCVNKGKRVVQASCKKWTVTPEWRGNSRNTMKGNKTKSHPLT